MTGEALSVFTVTLLILGLAAVAALIFLAWTGRLRRRKRIKILPEEKIKMIARTEPCLACGYPFRDGDDLARCKAGHIVHKICKPLVKEKCPRCGGKLE